MKHLHIDIETFCELDLSEVGVHRYASHPSFKIIIFAFSWDEGATRAINTYHDEYPGQSVPDEVWRALDDPKVIKIAHNAAFEITCISTYFDFELPTNQWYCTMIGAAYLGLPLGLDKVGQVLGLEEQKDARGKALIKLFCMPCKPTKKNEGRTINTPEDMPTEWREFMGYGRQDVRVEKCIDKYTEKFPQLPAHEWAYWRMDLEINAQGITIDREFIEEAIAVNTKVLDEVRDKIKTLTQLENPNSPVQLKKWLEIHLGYPVKSINKEYLADAIDDELLPDIVAEVLALRSMASRSSSSKYATMLNYASEYDDRVRDMFQFYGANRTGREAGRGPQPQNLKKTVNGDLAIIKEAIIKGLAELLYDDVTDLISRMVRTAFIAAEGKKLAVSDFAAIEARVLAWLAGEEWVLDVFKTHGKLYEATAAKMFNVPIESVTKGSAHRAKGKVAALALGYQGASGAMITMGALREGLTEAELPTIVSGWRAANPNIVKFWKELESAARHVIKNKSKYKLIKPYCSLTLSFERGYLFIELPSGRRLAYYGAHLDDGYKIRYWGLDQVKKIWVKMDAYGGLLTENVTQAIARDCLFDAMYRMKDTVSILMHIHDEIVAEAPEDQAQETLEAMEKVMSVSPLWANGLPLEGDGYVSKYYRKD